MENQIKKDYVCPTMEVLSIDIADFLSLSGGGDIDQFVPGENEGPFVPAR